ncbi:MAG: GNAT family N-acetyltransferase [Caulobacterales bacterium]
MTIDIVLRPTGSGAACQSILAELADWFGLPQSNAEYARHAEEGPAFLVETDGQAAAIMILKPHFEDTVEIYLLAVRLGRHRRGLGKALIARADAFAAERGARYLTVKTHGPSAPYEPYARTRAFYRATGFAALEEFTELWGPENPALLMVRPVDG